MDFPCLVLFARCLHDFVPCYMGYPNQRPQETDLPHGKTMLITKFTEVHMGIPCGQGLLLQTYKFDIESHVNARFVSSSIYIEFPCREPQRTPPGSSREAFLPGAPGRLPESTCSAKIVHFWPDPAQELPKGSQRARFNLKLSIFCQLLPRSSRKASGSQ